MKALVWSVCICDVMFEEFSLVPKVPTLCVFIASPGFRRLIGSSPTLVRACEVVSAHLCTGSSSWQQLNLSMSTFSLFVFTRTFFFYVWSPPTFTCTLTYSPLITNRYISISFSFPPSLSSFAIYKKVRWDRRISADMNDPRSDTSTFFYFRFHLFFCCFLWQLVISQVETVPERCRMRYGRGYN